MSPAAQEILLSFNGPDYLSHVILGHRLKYAVQILTAWREMLELSKRLERTRIAFLIVVIVAAGSLPTAAPLAYGSQLYLQAGSFNLSRAFKWIFHG
jgi:hypothetical protein